MDSNPEYTGCIICQDYTSASKTIAQSTNLFAPDKVIINFINCTHNGQKIIFNNKADVSGTKSLDSQLIYVYVDKEGFINYNPENDRYPTISCQ